MWWAGMEHVIVGKLRQKEKQVEREKYKGNTTEKILDRKETRT